MLWSLFQLDTAGLHASSAEITKRARSLEQTFVSAFSTSDGSDQGVLRLFNRARFPSPWLSSLMQSCRIHRVRLRYIRTARRLLDAGNPNNHVIGRPRSPGGCRPLERERQGELGCVQARPAGAPEGLPSHRGYPTSSDPGRDGSRCSSRNAELTKSWDSPTSPTESCTPSLSS